MAYIKVKDRRILERKEFRDYIKLSDDKVLDTKKNNIDLLGDDEIFVQVEDTEHYWISNYGRLTNNMRKDKTFFFHKMNSGNPERSVHWTIVTYDFDGSAIHEETSPEILVAKHFLIKSTGCNKIWQWHIDDDMNNNYYKNLIYVSAEEYELLRKHVKTVAELGREQEYYDYNTVKGNPAYSIWAGIYGRCYGGNSLLVNRCYDDAFMCDEWKNSRDAFAEWYSANYYECDGERMAVDKDLLNRGNKEYAPDKYRVYKIEDKYFPLITTFEKEDCNVEKSYIISPEGVKEINEKDVTSTDEDISPINVKTYSYEIPEELYKYPYLTIKKTVIEKGYNHWTNFHWNTLTPTDGITFTLKCYDELHIKEYFIFDSEEFYNVTEADDKTSIDIISTLWLDKHSGFVFTVSDTE